MRSDDAPLDRVELRGVAALGRHGVLPAEKQAPQRFVADVVMLLDTRRAAAGDDLAQTVDYGVVAGEVAAVLAGESVDLVETLAERIAATVLRHPEVSGVEVSVHKPQAPLTVEVADVVVTVARDRTRLPAAAPVVVAPAAEVAPAAVVDVAVRPIAETPPPVLPPVGLPVPAELSFDAVVAGTAPPFDAVPATRVDPVAGQPAAAPSFEVAPAADAPLFAASPPPSFDAVIAGASGPSFGTAPSFDAVLVGAVPSEPPRWSLAPVVDDEPAAAVVAAPAEPPVWAQPTEPARAGAAAWAAVDPPTFTPSAPPVPGQAAAPPIVVGPTRTPPAMVEPEAVLDALPPTLADVVIALGGNQGDVAATLRWAVHRLRALPGLEITAVGPLARTAAVGVTDQPDFLNTVVTGRTLLPPRELLHRLQALEDEADRRRDQHWGPRTLDLDLIVYGSLSIATDELELPHPRAHERAFVLGPWAMLDAGAVLPGLGGGPVARLAETAPDAAGLRWLDPAWMDDDGAGRSRAHG